MTTAERLRGSLQQARNEDEVVATLQQYVGSWLPSDLEKLPDGCRDLACPDADAVLALAVHLTTCDLKYRGGNETAELLQELARTFVAAAVRIGQLRPGPMSPLRPSFA